MDFFSRSRWYQYIPLPIANRASTATTLISGEPPPPIFMEGMLTAEPFLPLFGFGAPSRLIRIIAFQNSSGPNPRPLPTVRRSVPPIPLLVHPRARALSETD